MADKLAYEVAQSPALAHVSLAGTEWGIRVQSERKPLPLPRAKPATWTLRTPRGQRKYLTGDERRRFLAAAEEAVPALHAFCHLLAWSGCRLSEALAVHQGDLDLEAGSVSIWSLKKREAVVVREVPLPAGVIRLALGTFPHARPGDLLWPWGRTTGWRHVKDIMAAAGIEGLHASPKGLRHGFGLQAVRTGVPLNLVQKWLGHADIATTTIYANAMGAEEREIAARMW